MRVNSQVQTEIHIRHNQYQSKEGERRGDESVRENIAHNKHIFNRWGNRKVI